jgi:IMP cyclohydrolase
VDIQESAARNLELLSRNSYPGRGIVIGMTPDGRHYVQVYWIMGRSENSRNRVFVAGGAGSGEAGLVRTAPYDGSKVKDPSLIMYSCARQLGRCHIVSNGDQTDTVFEALQEGRSLEEALFTRSAEPDAPNYTPRITGLVDLDDSVHAYKLSVIKVIENDPGRGVREFFNYEAGIPGIGHCVHTYAGDGEPLPCFEGEPYAVPLLDNEDAVAERYWEALDRDNRVSLLAKFIDAKSGAAELRIINKRGR